MESYIPNNIINLLAVSLMISSIVMVVIQKFKSFSFITKEYQIGIMNIIFSLGFGIPFSIYFYNLNIIESCWASIFSIIGAPSIYEILKNQNIINFKPHALEDIEEIKRDDI